MDIQWKKIREQSSATLSFKEDLRSHLYENATFLERKQFENLVTKIALPEPEIKLVSHPSSFSFQNLIGMFSQKIRSMKQWITFSTGGIIAIAVVIPLFSIFISSPLSASSKSYIYTFTGNGNIEREYQKITPSLQQEIFEGDIIETQKGSAEIIFFEGTSLRIDKNSKIQIQKLHPQDGIFSTGGVTIQLIEGKIWTQNFHSPSKNSQFIIATKHSKILPNRADINIEHRGGKDKIETIKNNAQVFLEGVFLDTNIILEEGREIIFTPFDRSIYPQERRDDKSPWITSNIKRSKEHKAQYINQISSQMKEEFVTNEIAEKIHTFIAQDPSPEEMEQMITRVNLFMASSQTSYDVPYPEVFRKEENETQQLETPNQNLEKNISTEKNKENQKGNIKENIKKITQKKELYTKKKHPQYTQETLPINTPLGTPHPQKEHIKIDDDGFFPLETSEKLENNESNNTPKTASEILAENQKIKIQKASESFADQINIFQLQNSRKLQTQNILNSIPDTAENLDLIQAIEKEAPRDMKQYVREKRLRIKSIIREQKNKEKSNKKNSNAEKKTNIK